MPMTPYETAREASDREARARIGMGADGEIVERTYRERGAPYAHIAKIEPFPHYRGAIALEPLATPPVIPLGILVAARDSFFVSTLLTTPDAVRNACFMSLPMHEHGWNIGLTVCRHMGGRTWQVSRA